MIESQRDSKIIVENIAGGFVYRPHNSRHHGGDLQSAKIISERISSTAHAPGFHTALSRPII